MRIVIKIGASGNDPIDKPRPHERYDGCHSDSGRRHCARKTHTDCHIVGQHPFDEKLACFAKTRGVIRVEGFVDQVDYRNIRVDGRGFNRLATQEPAFILHPDYILPAYNVAMANEGHIASIQEALQQDKLDGWLFYSFRGSDPIAENILRLDHAKFTTRRWFYFVPAKGTPKKIVHAIETGTLDSLPGDKHIYLPWQQLHQLLRAALAGVKQVAMQYSPLNAIPYISRVDAGTVELVRSFGVEVVSSADLVQTFEAVWSDEQLETHLYAAKHMREIVDVTATEVGRRVRGNVPVTELDIQDFILKEFDRRDLTAGKPPIGGLKAPSAHPHYAPHRDDNLPKREGGFFFVGIWVQGRLPHAGSYDITLAVF